MNEKLFKCDEGASIVRETEKAYLVDTVTHGERWVPKSLCHPELLDGEVVTICIDQWFVKKEFL